MLRCHINDAGGRSLIYITLHTAACSHTTKLRTVDFCTHQKQDKDTVYAVCYMGTQHISFSNIIIL